MASAWFGRGPGLGLRGGMVARLPWWGDSALIAPSFTEPAAWPEKLTRRWKVEVGLGYATPLVVGNRIYMFSRQGTDEVMTALDATNGTTVWQTKYAATVMMHPAAVRHGDGPKSTPAFANQSKAILPRESAPILDTMPTRVPSTARLCAKIADELPSVSRNPLIRASSSGFSCSGTP